MTQTIVFANFLAPALHKTYQYIMEYIRQRTGIPAFLVSGASEHDFLTGAIDGGFICGLAYTHLAQLRPNPVELAAAPILIGERYQHKPRYYSDVVVRQSSRFQNLDDLRGCTWTYNEVASHSGYTLVHSTLLERGYPAPTDYFGRSIESGSHAHSLRLVLDGLADAAAIDSHVLDVIASNSPPLMARLRIIDSFGPSTIPPVVVSQQLEPEIRQQIKEALLTIHNEPFFAQHLREGQIERFVPITDSAYNDIRAIYASAFPLTETLEVSSPP